ncbi:TIGR00730 family Rossman fold protein [Thalassobaculum salexigens]|uniref:LOG family protein n=1 Tax=Thalassobaculum salexigens TaxID=455360 RepID=UPI00040E1A35|nr:TIGR00730 family Rossman fold protein [Thalassobaculum salexigens]
MSKSYPQSICVFCGSSSRVDEVYKAAATEIGDLIGARGDMLIYGGGRVGLMGLAADATLAAGGKVVGVIPSFLQHLEIGHAGLNELVVTDSMHERKRIMYERADAFVILPGGLGTLDETMEVLTWSQLKLSDKPVIIVDVNGFWQPLLALIEHTIGAGFTREENRGLYKVVDSPAGVFDVIGNWHAPEGDLKAKWL